MKLLSLALSTLLLAAAPLASMAAPAAPVSTPASPEPVDAEVRKIDAEAGKLTLRHGEIKHLDMPAMTMVFQLRDKAALKGLKVGDRVRVVIVAEGGKFVVTELKPAP